MFDNTIKIKDICYYIMGVMAYSILTLLFYWVLDNYYNEPVENFQWIVNHWKSILLNIIFVSMFILIGYLSLCLNKYQIIQDEIIITEYMFFRKTIDAKLPISAIHDVQLVSTFDHPMKHIQITTIDAIYDLWAITCRDALYDELLRNLKKSASSPKVSFYKQKRKNE